MSIKKEEIDSLPHYLQRIEELYTGNYSVLFRGQQCDDWDLVPRIGRTIFRKRFTSLIETEKKLVEEFDRLSIPHLTHRAFSSPWDRLALAQHHGLPTRLLDWTTNPLVALWFAIEKPAQREKDAAVWVFSADEADYASRETDPFTLSKTLIFRPPHLDARIIAQSGWFTIHKYMSSSKKFIPLNKNKSQKERLLKLTVPKICFSALRDDLARCGITKASLFPDLVGLCGHLEWQFSPLPDEKNYENFFET